MYNIFVTSTAHNHGCLFDLTEAVGSCFAWLLAVQRGHSLSLQREQYCVRAPNKTDLPNSYFNFFLPCPRGHCDITRNCKFTVCSLVAHGKESVCRVRQNAHGIQTVWAFFHHNDTSEEEILCGFRKYIKQHSSIVPRSMKFCNKDISNYSLSSKYTMQTVLYTRKIAQLYFTY